MRKNLALLARISTNVDFEEEAIIDMINEFVSAESKPESKSDSRSESKSRRDKDNQAKEADVFFNGKAITETFDPKGLALSIRIKRRKGELPLELSVLYDEFKEAVFISTEVGRVLRPLIVVKNGKKGKAGKGIDGKNKASR